MKLINFIQIKEKQIDICYLGDKTSDSELDRSFITGASGRIARWLAIAMETGGDIIGWFNGIYGSAPRA